MSVFESKIAEVCQADFWDFMSCLEHLEHRIQAILQSRTPMIAAFGDPLRHRKAQYTEYILKITGQFHCMYFVQLTYCDGMKDATKQAMVFGKVRMPELTKKNRSQHICHLNLSIPI